MEGAVYAPPVKSEPDVEVSVTIIDLLFHTIHSTQISNKITAFFPVVQSSLLQIHHQRRYVLYGLVKSNKVILQ